MKKLLFLCTGNYYRSRFSEIYFNWLAENQGHDWRAESRGLALDANNLGWMSHYTEMRLRNHGISFSDYQRFPLDATHDDFASSDHVVAVKEAEHRPLMQHRFPNWLERVEFWKVHDIDYASPDEALPQLEKHVTELLERLTR